MKEKAVGIKSGCLLKYMRYRIEKGCRKVNKTLELDYYYGIEAESFSFLRVPRLLIKDERFKPLSSDAKLLYGLILDRMSLSMKNGWLDEENRVYIVYTVDNMMEDLGIRSRATCAKIIKELDSTTGIGLIEKKRRGLGKPDIIYVKNFATLGEKKESEMVDNADGFAEVQKMNIKKFNNYTSGSSEIEHQEVQNLDLQKFKNCTSRSSETEPTEVQILNPNYNNNNYTDLSYINPINPTDFSEITQDRNDGMDYDSTYVEVIRENIAYARRLRELDAYDRDVYRELYALICEVVCVQRKSIRINGTEYPYELVRSRFLQLNGSHLEYVMDSLKKTSTKITNIRAYLLTVLFNAPVTLTNMIDQEVRHDMFGGGWEEKGIL